MIEFHSFSKKMAYSPKKIGTICKIMMDRHKINDAYDVRDVRDVRGVRDDDGDGHDGCVQSLYCWGHR